VAGGVLIELRGVGVHRGRRAVLRDVDLALAPGDAVHLAGANGSGKTSLLRVVAGLASPRGGTLARNARCAFAPERARLAPALRGAEWLEAMRRLRGAEAVDWAGAARDSGLDPAALHAPSATLSKGMLQRLALLDALHAPVAALILDEPFSGLDSGARGWLADRLTARRAAGAAVLLTDHDGAMEGRMATSATLRLEDGRAVASAAGADVATVALVATHPDGRRSEERVAPAAVDARLRTLLDDGWHIERVGP
jgi:ABC-2 type transport system ATP-binding protein